MNILIVCQHFWPENFRINDICQDFLAAGHQVEVLCGMPNYPKGKYFKGYNYFKPRRENYHGAEVFRVGEIPQNKKLGALAVLLNYYFFPFASIFSLPRLLRRKHDIVFLYSLTPIFMSWPGLVLAKLKKIPSVMYVLDYWPDSLFSVIKLRSKIFRDHYKWVSKRHYRKVNYIITPSDGMRQRFIDDYQISPERLTFIPQSCDPAYEVKVRDEALHQRFDGRTNFVFAGNIGPAQALEVLVDAVALVAQQSANAGFRFIVVGDGMSKQAVLDKVREKAMENYFEFIGFQPLTEIQKFHELADVLFVSLADEPLFDIMIPAKVQSYMAAGKPILASLNGEGADVIRDSGSGLTCQAMSSEELAKAILEFMDLPESRLLEMGRNASEFYKNNYKSDIISARLNHFLADID
ncbi:MAG: glycosyltransferase family 4 protein [Clostridiaceae bacterium]|nr:glycosyltransferase family 4 protein [Clostridiaceae bacterium]